MRMNYSGGKGGTAVARRDRLSVDYGRLKIKNRPTHRELSLDVSHSSRMFLVAGRVLSDASSELQCSVSPVRSPTGPCERKKTSLPSLDGVQTGGDEGEGGV